MDLLTGVIEIVLLIPVFLLVGIAWAVRRRKHGLGVLFALLLTLYFVVHEELVPGGFQWYEDQQYSRELFGIGVVLGNPAEEYEEPRSWNGDGYSIFVFDLPESVALLFRNNAPSASHPVQGPSRKNWVVSTWQRAPVAASHHNLVAFAVDPAPEVLAETVKAALANPLTWYAIRYKEVVFKQLGDEPYPINVDFYIVDLVGGKLYLINHNT